MRLIDADKLAVRLKYYINHSLPGEKYAYEMARKEVCNAPTVNEWIPCSERLPLKEAELISDDVLVYLESDYQVVGKYRKNGDWFDSYNNRIRDNVIAWIPLPAEPYKGDEDK